MTRFIISFAILAAFSIASPAHAFPSAAPPGTAIADYNPATGEISVSINGVISWYVQSASFSLTGDEPSFAPTLPAISFFRNDDIIIGEVTFFVGSATDVSLGNVAALGLPLGDLTINWNTGLGTVLETSPVFYSTNSTGMTNYRRLLFSTDQLR